MAIELKQSLKLAQQLVITPQLQQAIKLLQLNRLELATLIEKELLENPVLEDQEELAPEVEEVQSTGEKHEQAKNEDRGHDHSVEEIGKSDSTLSSEPPGFDWENYLDTYNAPGYQTERDMGGDESPIYENVMSQSESLQDHLLWQLHLSNATPEQIKIGNEIIGNINDDGYLKASDAELMEKTGATQEEYEHVLRKIQEFDPWGVAARDVKECLLLQTKKLGAEGQLASTIIEDYLDELERHDYNQIAKKTGLDIEKVKEVVAVIAALDPKPGRAFSQEQPQYITPDVYVHKSGDNYVVTVNDDGLPKLKISNFYRQAIMRGSAVKGQTKDYIQDRLRSAMWLIKSIHQRHRTLYRVSSSIVKFQKDFFEKGMDHLKPLVLKEVAEDIEMHESTISRVTTNKFMHTPRGIFELKFFFNSGINQLEGGGVASEVVKLMVKKMIDEESSSSPLSDQDIVDKLKGKNVDIARRTVAKYRETLGILPSSKRRKIE